MSDQAPHKLTGTQIIKRIIVAVVLFLAASSLIVFYVLAKFETNKESAAKRTESDFITENYTIDQIWERQLVSRQGLENDKVIKSYIFIKPRGENFNLRFSETDAFGSEKSRDKILSQIKEGDEISAKVLKTQLENARKGSAFLWLKRFIQGDRREVSIYKLIDNGATVSEADVNSFDVVETDFMDGFNRTVTILLIAIGGLFIFIFSFIKRKQAIKKQNL